MTCIVGYIEVDKVYIGGDSAGVSGLDVIVRKDPKVFKNGEFVFGCTSSFRMINILRFSLSIPKPKEGQDLYEFMCTDFINSVRQSFKDGGYAKIKDSEEYGGTFLIGYRGRLFEIGDDFQVGESADNFQAVGCGAPYAVGALFAVKDDNLVSPGQKVLLALQSAAHFSAGVRPPFIVEFG